MKNILVFILSLGAFCAFAQPDDEVYYTDSKVKNQRFGIALLGNPTFTDRRLINDDIALGGGYDLLNDEAKGSFQFNYEFDVFYSLGGALDIGVGIGRAGAKYTVDSVLYYENRAALDTALGSSEFNVNMITVPIKLNFHTSVTDIVDLEVVPMLELNFVNKYEQKMMPFSTAESDILIDRTSLAKSMKYSVGISLGAVFNVTENWGVVVRANLKYMINPLIEEKNYPREILYTYGGIVGLRYKF